MEGLRLATRIDVGKLSVSQNGFDLSPDSASSSDESSILEAFKKRIEKKWTLKRQPEDMNLKTSPGIDSTEDTEENYNLAQDEVKNKVLKKTETKEKDGSKDRKRKLCSTKPKKHRGSDSNSENEGSKNKTNVKNKIRKSKNTKEVKRKVENNAHKNKVSEDEMLVEEPEEQKDKNNGKKLAGVKTKPEKSKVKEEEGSKDEGENNQEKIVSKHNKTVCDDKEENTNEEKKENTFEDSIEIDEKIEEESDNSELENAANEYRKYLENEEKTKFDGLESSSKGSDKEIEVAKVGASRDTEEEKTRKSSMLLCNEKTKFVGLESSSEESDREVKLAKVGASKDAEEENTMKRSELFCDKKTKFVGLGSSSEELDKELKVSEVEACGDIQGGKSTKNSKGKEKSLKKRSERNKVLSKKPILLESSDEEQDKKEEEDSENSGSCSSDKRLKKGTKKPASPVLLSSGDSSDSKIIPQKKIRKKSRDSEVLEISEDEKPNSDKEETKKKSEKGKKKPASPVLLSSGDSSDSEIIPQKKIRKKSSDSEVLEISEDEKPKKKRKRIKCADSSDESGGSGGKRNVDEKSTQGESPGKGGRKNIKKIKTKDDLEEATKEAAEEEKERRRRIEERQKLFNQMFEIPETQSLDKLVLDFDPKEKKELISVNKDLVAKMKPHQAKGVKFMWDSCFESLSELKTKKGSGCILAHCMGLGKTFQVISLIHTVLTHEDTGVHTVMVVCPLSTVLNWVNEFDKWLDGIEGGDEVEVFHLTRYKTNPDRARELRRWQHNGGVLVIGYEMFRNLTCETAKKFKPKIKKDFQETLIDPGADLIVCDEGHMLKNEATALSKAMTRVKTLRRIVLTGTPMQNNLKEYHCMVQFVKPSLLGTRREFLNRFVNPITNGQFVDSTESDVKVMKRRAHVLHKMLEGLVQRFDYNVLTPFLPPKHEYVISVCLSELQVKLYKHYLENFSQQSDNTKAGSRLFQDWQALGRIWTHPRVLKMNTDKTNWLKEKKALEDESEDEEGSLKDFIDDSEAETTEESSDDSSSEASIKSEDEKKKKKGPAPKITTRSTRSRSKNVSHLDSSGEEKEEELQTLEDIPTTGGAWWSEMVDPEHLDDINHSAKLVLLFAILKECQMIEDKVLVFSQSLLSLDLIEYFLDKIDEATQQNSQQENLGNHQGAWSKGLDYFRLDGSTSSENRNLWCKAFNRDDNPRARLFLISTRAGGLGINLTAANRVIIFDASWNPSHDVQSIFRVYRFGQKKPCYVYRFIAHGTMEEKVYDRQVAKQSMSNRVVDEQQVHRHFSSNDLNELYSFTPPTKKEDRPIPALPKDNLFAEILQQFRDWIEKYHEHDSLLENVVEEELNEEERKLAWEDYETEKKRGFLPQTTGMGPSSIYNNTMNQQIELLRQALKSKYPNKPEQELNQMLVYQVSLLMKQQQMARSQAGGSAVPGMYQAQPHPLPFMNNKLTQEQLFNLQQQQLRMQYLQQMQMRQAQQATPTPEPKLTEYQKQVLMQQQASLAMLQMKQLQHQQHQQQNPQAQNILLNKLNQPKKRPQAMNNQYPKNAFPNFQGMGLEQNYGASRQKNPGVKITEITDDPLDTTKPSDSST